MEGREKILYYIAGLFDCGGKISFRKDPRSKTSVYLHITIKSKTQEALEPVKELFGGSLRKNKEKVYLILSHKKAREFLKTIKDYTLSSKEEIENVLKLFEIKFSNQYEKERKKKILKEVVKDFKNTKVKHGKSSVRKFVEE